MVPELIHVYILGNSNQLDGHVGTFVNIACPLAEITIFKFLGQQLNSNLVESNCF